MATYTTQSDLEKQYGVEQVLIASDRDGNGSADTGVIEAAIAHASEQIDSYVSRRFDLPLSTTPPVLTRVANVLAMYHMSGDSGSMTDDKAERYKLELRWLERLADGKVDLGSQEDREGSRDSVTVSSITNPRLFTRSKMAGLT